MGKRTSPACRVHPWTVSTARDAPHTHAPTPERQRACVYTATAGEARNGAIFRETQTHARPRTAAHELTPATHPPHGAHTYRGHGQDSGDHNSAQHDGRGGELENGPRRRWAGVVLPCAAAQLRSDWAGETRRPMAAAVNAFFLLCQALVLIPRALGALVRSLRFPKRDNLHRRVSVL